MNSYNSVQLWHNPEGKSWFREMQLDISRLKDQELVIESLYSFVSAGTEKTILLDPPSEGELVREMSVPYMLGHFNREFTYGYSLVGRVVAGRDNWLGKIIHVMHPHQKYALVNEPDVLVIPDHIPALKATLISNLETVLNAIWDSGISIGDRVLIVGFGNIGALLARVIQSIPGIDISIFELDPYRREIAESCSLEVMKHEDLGKDFTVSFNTSGSGSGLQLAIDKVAIGGKIVELSWYGSREISLILGGSFHYGRKKIISSQVSRLPGFKSNLFSVKSRKDIVLKLLEEIDFDFLFDKEIPFDEAPEYYARLIDGREKDIASIFKYK